MRKLTTAEFIERAREKHGRKYDYSTVEYKKSKEKVTIICPLHGEFEQNPGGHLMGSGCAQCAGRVKLTTPEFIDKARKVHGDKYNYSKVDYKKSSDKVTIICPDHGAFKQTPNTHLGGGGCSACGRLHLSALRTHTTDKFVSAARKKHGGRYDYSNADYRNNSTAVKIICKKHGEFEQRPDKHLAAGAVGCQICAREQVGRSRQGTKEIFVKKARRVHGNRFDYSKVNYKNSITKVAITCPEHGDFEQPPGKHTAGDGCPGCSGNKPLSTSEYIDKARKVHGDKYDYSKTKYINSGSRITVICPEHREFRQKANNHLIGKGCPRCGVDIVRGAKYESAKENFAPKASIVHGNRYEYSKVVYKNARDKVTIICPEHGPFIQSPTNHLNGSGCPKCSAPGIDINAPGILYYLRVETHTHTFWKIGITNRTVEKRFTGDLDKITAIKIWHYTLLYDALKREADILKEYAHDRYCGADEPLSRGGNTELFTRDVLGLDKDCA